MERLDFRRDESEYSIRDMSGLARDLLRRYGTTPTTDHRYELAWDNEHGHFAICSNTLDSEFPVYRLAANDSRRVNSHLTYYVTENAPHVTAQDSDGHVIESDDPFSQDLLVREYLANNPYLSEPLINRDGTKRFNLIAAHFAVQAAAEAEDIYLTVLKHFDHTPCERFSQTHAAKHVAKQGIKVDGKEFLYSRSQSAILQALREEIRDFNPKRMLPRKDINTELDQGH